MLFTKVIKQAFLKHGKKSFLIFQIILDHFSKDFFNLTQALDQCKTNLGNNYFVSPLVKQFLNHHGKPYLNLVEPCSSQTSKTLDLTHDFPPLQNQDHLLREELEILKKKYDRS